MVAGFSAAALAFGLAGMWVLLRAVRGPGVLARIRRTALAGAFLAVAFLFGVCAAFVRAFLAFSEPTLVARVWCVRDAGPEAFTLFYEPAEEAREARQQFSLRGDQWVVSGGIIKWHSWLSGLGVPSYHRPVRVAGQFADHRRQADSISSVAPLGSGWDAAWETAYRVGKRLPFVEAVYGSSAYAYVDGVTHGLYITPWGYLIKPVQPRDTR